MNLIYTANHNQIIHTIQKSWKDAFITDSENIKNLVFQHPHLINNSLYSLFKQIE